MAMFQKVGFLWGFSSLIKEKKEEQNNFEIHGGFRLQEMCVVLVEFYSSSIGLLDLKKNNSIH